MVGALTLDERRVVEMLARLSESPAGDAGRLLPVVRRHLQPIRCGKPPDFRWVVGLLDDAFEQARLQAGADLLLFRKGLHTLEGVIADVAPGADAIDEAFFVELIQHLAAEWPLRWVSLPASRSFATRLSNLDLAQLMFGVPFYATRYWMTQTLGRRWTEG